MDASAFLHTVTTRLMSVTKTGGRQSVPTWADDETGVAALISPISMRHRMSLMGAVTDETHLLFLPAGTDVNKGDRVKDEDTLQEYTIVTQPVTYKNPLTGESSHMQCTIMPVDPND